MGQAEICPSGWLRGIVGSRLAAAAACAAPRWCCQRSVKGCVVAAVVGACASGQRCIGRQELPVEAGRMVRHIGDGSIAVGTPLHHGEVDRRPRASVGDGHGVQPDDHAVGADVAVCWVACRADAEIKLG
jgi:hypothetical protein